MDKEKALSAYRDYFPQVAEDDIVVLRSEHGDDIVVGDHAHRWMRFYASATVWRWASCGVATCGSPTKR